MSNLTLNQNQELSLLLKVLKKTFAEFPGIFMLAKLLSSFEVQMFTPPGAESRSISDDLIVSH